MAKKPIQVTSKWAGIVILVLAVAGIIYFFFSTQTAANEIPDYVTGEMREVYAWAQTSEGDALLEQMPCYCGCKFEGHLHARHCFWRDDGSFDKHGITCAVCFDIAKKTKTMHETGSNICEIRDLVDQFYEPNKELGTNTPYPVSCDQ